jgi:hypothetical protein
MATIIQRCLNTNNNAENSLTISDAEKAQLLDDINKLNDNSKE